MGMGGMSTVYSQVYNYPKFRGVAVVLNCIATQNSSVILKPEDRSSLSERKIVRVLAYSVSGDEVLVSPFLELKIPNTRKCGSPSFRWYISSAIVTLNEYVI